MNPGQHSTAADRGSASASLRFIEQFLRRRGTLGRSGLLLGQLDTFNRISSTFGHEVAAQFCAEHAAQLRATLPEGSHLIRLSERRFVVVLPLESVESVIEIAARLTEERHAQVDIDGDSFLVDVTLGAAVYPDHADDAANLFRRAELALKEASAKELAFDIYCPDTTRQHAALWKLESDLSRAIREGALEVYFQPQVRIGASVVTGAEALVRWRRSTDGFMSPEQFIPLAERSGSIVPLTWLVLERSLEAARAWGPVPAPFTLAVNVAPQLLTHPELLPRLERAAASLQDLGIALAVELTEDGLVRSDDATPQALTRIRELGVGIAIDDFGKGYSSLGYLKEIPATEVKIDQRFVATLASDAKDRHIVRTIIELARAFGMAVVAEGIDCRENLAAAAELGCEYAQGYFIARPMRADLLPEWMEGYRRTGNRLGLTCVPGSLTQRRA